MAANLFRPSVTLFLLLAWVLVFLNDVVAETVPFSMIGFLSLPGSNRGDKLGTSVSMSSGGTLITIAGTPGASGGLGGALLFQEPSSGADFSRSLALNPGDVGPFSNGPSHFGTSVAISQDGKVAIVGGPGDEAGRGTVLFYVRTTSSVSSFTFVQKVNTTSVNADAFGSAVALSSDGAVAVVGAKNAGGGTGGIYVYKRQGTSNVWVTGQTQPITGSSPRSTSGQGASVACDSACAVILVGGPTDGGSGAAWALTRNIADGSILSNQRLGPGTFQNEAFGQAVASNGDGSIILISRPGRSSGGEVLTFTRSSPSASYTQQAILVAGVDSSGTSFGSSVALSTDGRAGVIGAPHEGGDLGGVFRITGDGAGSFSVSTRFTDTFCIDFGLNIPGCLEGASVSCNTDTSVCAMGAPNDNDGTGSIYFLSPASSSNLLLVLGTIPIIIISLASCCFVTLVTGACIANYRSRQRVREERARMAQNPTLINVSGAIQNPTAWNRPLITGTVATALRNKGKRYAVYISYNPVSAAADAAAIYEQFLSVGFTPDQIFFNTTSPLTIIESTEAVQLSLVLLQLQSTGLFYRSSCLLEAFTAIQAGIPIIPVQLDRYYAADTNRLKEAVDFAAELEKASPDACAEIRRSGWDPNVVGKAVLREVTLLPTAKYKSSESKLVRDAMFTELANVVLSKLNAPPQTYASNTQLDPPLAIVVGETPDYSDV